jgi:hypothetical protein
MPCDRCSGKDCTKAGRRPQARPLSRGPACGRRRTARSSSAFCGYHFPDDSKSRPALRDYFPNLLRTLATTGTQAVISSVRPSSRPT